MICGGKVGKVEIFASELGSWKWRKNGEKLTWLSEDGNNLLGKSIPVKGNTIAYNIYVSSKTKSLRYFQSSWLVGNLNCDRFFQSILNSHFSNAPVVNHCFN